MARQTITKQLPYGPYPTLPVAANALDLVETAADVANKDQFAPSGDDLVIIHNTGASAYTITFTSVADEFKRTGDVTTFSLGAGEIAAFRFKKPGWMQSDGFVYIEASNAAVKWAVIQLV
ncbi:hypothetical protein FBQ81_03215 [Chloroflexi bacterium CFX6]|nr:hypothetical protein [Chloroflexi bacterium CFX6]